MKSFILCVILFYSCSSKFNLRKQQIGCKSQYDSTLKMNVYDYVDEMPEYIGGQGELIKYILKNAVYPDQDIVQGTVKLTLIIDTNGNVRDAKVLNKEKEQYTPLDMEILKVVQLMPKWQPGKCTRKNVPVRLFIPIQLNR